MDPNVNLSADWSAARLHNKRFTVAKLTLLTDLSKSFVLFLSSCCQTDTLNICILPLPVPSTSCSFHFLHSCVTGRKQTTLRSNLSSVTSLSGGDEPSDAESGESRVTEELFPFRIAAPQEVYVWTRGGCKQELRRGVRTHFEDYSLPSEVRIASHPTRCEPARDQSHFLVNCALT